MAETMSTLMDDDRCCQDYVNTWLMLTKEASHEVGFGPTLLSLLQVRPNLRCKSGLVLSVQASMYHHCYPKTNQGPYDNVEVMIIEGQGLDNRWYKYSTDGSTPLLYAFVPVHIVNETIHNNGGIEDE